MLSTTQAGFCTQKDPIHQLKNVVMALEDAKLFHKDIYALIVDFTSAFNTTDPDRMLWIMYDLGFLTDAIDAVKISMRMPPPKSSFLQGSAQVKFGIPVERGTN